jgi:hypothetical protein
MEVPHENIIFFSHCFGKHFFGLPSSEQYGGKDGHADERSISK